MQITMIGHCTVVIEVGGQKIITDPYFSPKGNPAYRRLRPAALSREEAMRDVSLVLLSHNHFDHTDAAFFRTLPSNVPLVTPRQTAWLPRFLGAKRVVGVRPWESRSFGSVTITAVPASHTAITLGFVIESEGRQIYFAGDTYYRPFMKEIGQRFKPDLALLPVTTYRIPMTMGEKEAVLAVRDLAPRTVIPIHLGIQPRSPLMRTDHTPEGFERRLREVDNDTQVVVLGEGETRFFP